MQSFAGGVLEGYVSEYDPRGWLKLFDFKFNGGNRAPVNVIVYIFEAGALNHPFLQETLPGSFVIITEVHPIYIWNSLAGFTTGIHSTISESPQLRLKRSRALDSPSCCGGISTDSGNDKCVLFLVWQALSCGRIRSALYHAAVERTAGLSEAQLREAISIVLRGLNLCIFNTPQQLHGVDTSSDFIFYVIKACHDVDWLCCKLPEVLNPRHVLKMVRKLSLRGNGEYSDFCAYLGMCGRENKSLDLSFPACMVGTMEDCDLIRRVITVIDSSGATVSVHVAGDLQRLYPLCDGSSAETARFIVVVFQPCLFAEHGECLPSEVFLLCTAERIGFLRLDHVSPDDHSGVEAPLIKEQRSAIGSKPPTITRAKQVLSRSQMDFCIRRKLSVRCCLIASTGSYRAWGCDIEGVVVFKEFVLSNRPFERGSVGCIGPVGSKCAIVLRDKYYGDRITAFVPADCALHATIGSLVCIRSCTLKLNKTQKNVYIEFDKSKGSIVDIIGIVPDVISLYQICEGSQMRKYTPCCLSDRSKLQISNKKVMDWKARLIDLGMIAESHQNRDCTPCRHMLSPLVTLNNLDSICSRVGGISRCTWTCRGSLTQIVSLQAYLRCAKCMSKVEPIPQLRGFGTYHSGTTFSTTCHRCAHTSASFAWQMSFFFDDGTGECRVSVDDEMVFSLLSKCCSADNIETVRKMTENVLPEVGTVRAYAFERNSGAQVLDPDERLARPYDDEVRRLLLYNNDKVKGLTSEHAAVSILSSCEASLMSLISSSRFSTQIYMQVRQIPISQASLKRRNVSAPNILHGPTGHLFTHNDFETRKIKVQRSGTPEWVVENMEPITTFRPKIRLEVLRFDIYQEKELHRSCWELISSLGDT